jgi:N-acetylmuramic acid 6-phosphate etherase
VIGAIKKANENNVLTCGLSCNAGSLLGHESNFSITPVVGPEFVTGSTRMKAGTAQKLVLNMISTSLMIKLGRVQGNKMVDMQLSNHKLVDRGAKMVQEKTGVEYEIAKELLLTHGSVRSAVNFYLSAK